MMQKGNIRGALMGLALAAAAGCGPGWDPERSRLSPADRAFVVAPEGVKPPLAIAVNTRVQIVADPGPESDQQRLVSVIDLGHPDAKQTLAIPRRCLFRYHLAQNDTRPDPDRARADASSKQSSWYPLTNSW
jgi:hypothetical protein